MNTAYQATLLYSGCNFELWVNDFRADEQSNDDPAVYDLPLNAYIGQGENHFRLVMKPLSFNLTLEPVAKASLTISQGTLDGDKYTLHTELAKVESTPIKPDEDAGIMPVTMTVNATIVAHPDYRIITPDELDPITPNMQALQKLYTSLYENFKSNNTEALLKMMSHKIKHYGNSLHTSTAEEGKRTMAALDRLSKKKLEPLDFKGYKMTTYHKSRLCCLEDEDGDQPIMFTTAAQPMATTYYPVYFGKEKGDNEWKIVL